MTAAALNTHGVMVDFGKHRGMLLTRVPVGYLKWMVNEKGLTQAWRELADAELKRRNHQLPTIELSGHAIDNASLRVRKIWHETKLDEEGLYSWLIRMTREAIEQGERTGDAIRYCGMKFIVEDGAEWPVLKTIMSGNAAKDPAA